MIYKKRPNFIDAGNRFHPGFTLIEIMVVVAILALLAVMTMPAIRAMQAGNAKAQAYNNINAALQAARSYAIMNGVNTAARFQPNGKISLVYRVGQDAFQAQIWGTALPSLSFPNVARSEDSYVYLPVLNFEALELPKGYAIINLRDPTPANVIYSEPFYVCYNRDGTIAVNEVIYVALATQVPGNVYRPVNPDFTRSNVNYVWDNASFQATWTDFKTWIVYAENPANVPVASIPYRRLARFYLVADPNNLPEKATLLDINSSDFDYRVDHYSGLWLNATGTHTATTQLGIFQTPDNWDKMPLFVYPAPATYTGSKEVFINHATDGIVIKQKFDTIHINPYTGRVIRPVE
jgi:prepilin-type N-terminal cleavage/methylation domain-containing protein